MKAKYIIVDSLEAGDSAIVFPAWFSHANVAFCLEGICGEVVSAGFVDTVHGDIQASGESDSLGVKSRPIDAQIIESMLFDD